MSKAIFSGTFDPITLGHIDIISRSAKQFDSLIVAVMVDDAVITSMSSNDRVSSVKAACLNIANVEVVGFSGLLIDFARKNKVKTLVRSLRSADDFQYEYRMSVMNKSMSLDLETVFFMSSPEFGCISSTLVRQILKCQGDAKAFVPEVLLAYLDQVKWR